MLIYILIIIAILIAIFIIIQINNYNKFQRLNTKISEAYNNMDILFEKKANLLERAVNIIKENNEHYKEEILLDNLTKIKNQTLTRFELNRELTLGFRDYKGLIDLDTSLASLDSLKGINDELLNVDNDLNASKKYYNDNVVLYNNLVKCFPSSLVAKIHKFEELEFFKEEKIETLEILKEEKQELPVIEEEVEEEKIDEDSIIDKAVEEEIEESIIEDAVNSPTEEFKMDDIEDDDTEEIEAPNYEVEEDNTDAEEDSDIEEDLIDEAINAPTEEISLEEAMIGTDDDEEKSE